ncbi:9491_t:CDS:2, partial [Racocetra persica]
RSVKELWKIIYDPFIPDGNEFDKSLHHDLDFINYAYRSMLFLWDREENPFDSSRLEGWYEMNIWSKLIDPTFHNINIDLVRGEGMSCASSDRKNFIRTINDRKKIGRKEDGFLEAGRKWEGQNGTKYLNDSLKLNKMMKDMIAQLTTICDEREDLVRKLEVIGILHGANRIQIITMDYPKGYISRVKHWKFYEVSGRLTKSNPLALVLKEILCAKAIILRTLDLINQKDDINLENFLNDSDEQDGYHTPPPKVNTTPTFETPKTEKTK